MKSLTFGAAIVLMVAVPVAGRMPAQEPVQIPAAQRAFEAGQYDQALQSIVEARERGEPFGPPEAFLAGHIQLRRNQSEDAKGDFTQLVESGDDTWRLVGESSIAFIDQNNDRALELADQAVARVNERAAAGGPAGPGQEPAGRIRDFAAFYQQGLVKSRREDWAGAAEAFDRATQLHPSFAYAHYYAGLTSSRMKRPDRVASHFEVFLKLAPNAPERGAVTSIMRTLRGA